MVTPPDKNGKVPANILAAARICGVNRVFRVGGAQAIAALAYGTESIPKVDKIVGPGNQFVAEAKKQVFGKVGIDMVAGPSEILVIADGKNNPQIVAADLLSQAEHDQNASAVLVTDSEELALAVQAAIEEQIPKLKRAEIARASIDNNGKIIVADSLLRAIEEALGRGLHHVTFLLPYSMAGQVDQLHSQAKVLRCEYTAEGVEIEAVCDEICYGRLRGYEKK